MNYRRKQNNWKVTPELIQARMKSYQKSGFSKAKWMLFCEILEREGFECWLYEARKTFSKYITITVPGTPRHKGFKVRFSNHKPIKFRELEGDCDFFVGHTHLGVTTYYQALRAVRDHFQRIIVN